MSSNQIVETQYGKMSGWQSICRPCINCGKKPDIVSGFGCDHNDLRCPCGRQTDTDGKVKWAIVAWNDMNKTVPPTEGKK